VSVSSSGRWPLLAWSMSAVVVAVALACTLLILVFHSTASPIALAGELLAVAAATVGALVASRLPSNPVGWIFCATGMAWALDQLAGVYAADAAFAGHGSTPGALLAAWLQYWLWLPGFVLVLGFLPLRFPDGQLASSRWRVPAVGFTVVAVVAVIGQAVDGLLHLDNGLGPDGALIGKPSPWASALGLAVVVSVIGCVVSLVLRYRYATAETRQQIKWLAYAVAITASISVQAFTSSALSSNQDLTNWGVLASVVALTGIPVAAGIAILKYRLYDIDVVISRTLVYGALAAFITAVYVGIAVGIGSLVGSGGKPNLGLSILATSIVAVGFQPVRERLQTFANRLVYGKRATPYEVLSQFSERVAESYASDDVLPRMARVLAEGTAAELAEVWLRSGGVLRRAAAFPLESLVPGPVELHSAEAPMIPDADRTVEVRHQGELLGALTVSKRRGESLTPIEVKLMDDLAHQAGLVLKNVGLTADLQARLDDLRASRQRLVAAQDDERRKLERNLHDGAQQHLVAIKVKLGLVEMLATRNPEKAKATIVALKHDADEALETLRDLARGIYPPLLAEKGLPAALQSQAGKATLPVRVDADGVGRYPQETEAALYFCTLEALQNVQKYAQASTATVCLREEREHLTVEVTDDGRGFDVTAATRGAGLTNMEDRLEALGGTLQIESTPGVGTTLRARVSASHTTPVAGVSDHMETARQPRPLLRP
jgi:signal transduction histidine kinase